MTIKEVEQELGIPRATVRFYEKEGLLDPKREENGYRDYSENDVDKLKKIIILRKLGIAVGDIEDIFDGAKTMPEALAENLNNLQKQMEELKGAMNLCRRMQEDGLELASFRAEDYWTIMEEEEKKGHPFMDIAKDIVETEKKVIFRYFSWTDKNGNPYDWRRNLRDFIIMLLGLGIARCIMKKEISIGNLLWGVGGVLSILVIESLLSIPMYFLGKRFPWIEKHRIMVLVIFALGLCVGLLLLGNLLGI